MKVIQSVILLAFSLATCVISKTLVINLENRETANQIFKVELGDEIEIDIPENPLTGYLWYLYDSAVDNSKLEQLSTEYEMPQREGEPDIIGSGGFRVILLKAVDLGTQQIKLVKARMSDIQAIFETIWSEETYEATDANVETLMLHIHVTQTQ